MGFMKSKASKEIIERLAKLKASIERHRYNYHVLDKPEISDEALDSLKNELVKIETEYPELITPDSPSQRVAGAPLPEFKKVAHKVPQWSFNDAFTIEDIREFDARTKRFLKSQTGKDIWPSYVCELKIDGLKIVSEYKKGLLVGAATRGDGKVGEDVRRLKWHVNWVQNVARQFGLYLWWALVNCGDMLLVREDRSVCTAGVPVVPPGAAPGSYVQPG